MAFQVICRSRPLRILTAAASAESTINFEQRQRSYASSNTSTSHNLRKSALKMHYIRFLKPPQISGGILTAKLTITTDLGDDFLNANLPLQLIIHTSYGKDRVIGDPLRRPNIVEWKSGMRELPISIPLPKSGEVSKEHGSYDWQLLIWPCLTGVEKYKSPPPSPMKYRKTKPLPASPRNPAQHSASEYTLSMSDILDSKGGETGHGEEYVPIKGLVLPAESALFNLISPNQHLPAEITRTFRMDFRDGYDNEFELRIEEETGNSIARHIWDAGVVFSAVIRELAMLDAKPSPDMLPQLQELLQGGHGEDVGGTPEGLLDGEEYDPRIEYQKALNVLELGTGCAIVSATLSHCLPYARVIATDLEEAKDVAVKNLSRNRTKEIDRNEPTEDKHLPGADSSYEVLDWTEELGGRVAERNWDLILVADCTYNSDVVPDLVQTLRHLVNRSPEVLIAVALKWRHDSEAIFHELMRENGLVVINKHTERCGNFDIDATGKDEEIEIYLYKDEKTEEARDAVEEREKEEGEELKEHLRMERDSGRKRELSDPVTDQRVKK